MTTDLREQLQLSLGANYRLDRELGGGGMSRVFVAEDISLGRTVVVKVVLPETAAGMSAGRFKREIAVAAKLQHPHIVPLLAAGEMEGLPYYTMPMVEGQSLRGTLARDGPLQVARAVGIMRDVLQALAYAHEHGVVHRDIKPDNVLLCRGVAMVTDFGIAKALSASRDTARADEPVTEATLTSVGTSLGTPEYMAPEQIAADPGADHRLDLYAFGVMAYEMLVGRTPFHGMTPQKMLTAQMSQRPREVAELRAELPPALTTLVMRCLEKDPADRPQSADEARAALEEMTRGGGEAKSLAGRPGAKRNRRTAIIIGAVIALALVPIWRTIQGSRETNWARAQITQVRVLADEGDIEAAFQLARRVRAVIPPDSTLDTLWRRVAGPLTLRTEPAGARVSRRAYATTDTAWEDVGTTPLDSVSVPRDLSVFRIERSGFRPAELATVPASFRTAITLDSGDAPNGEMVQVLSDTVRLYGIAGLGDLPYRGLGSFRIGKYEVTNRQFKRFVEDGGYSRRELWESDFVKGGRRLSWKEAIALFKDGTGRLGPSTWEGGSHPPDQEDFPIGGVSWYEAMAYARYAGERLPTIYHWAAAARVAVSSDVVPQSNFGGTGPARVGEYRGITFPGAYDMAGNVREWCLNASGSRRFILGGAWDGPTYMFSHSYALDPFDRSPQNGIRLASYDTTSEGVRLASHQVDRTTRDFASETPVADAVYDVYARQYDYDRTPLNARVERVDTSTSWIRHIVSFDATYGAERVIAYVFLPRQGRPPFQTILVYPGASALNASAVTDLRPRGYEFINNSGRAVVLPIYKGTFERGDSLVDWQPNASNMYKDHVLAWAKDFRRTVDYLHTRPDVDTTRLGYFGTSWGGYMSGIMIAVEPRIRAAVLNIPGLAFQRSAGEVDPVNFLPRVRIPVVMIGGRFDDVFPYETSQVPMFRLLGTAPEHKRHVVFPAGHGVPRASMIAETLNWFDRYLAPSPVR